jgi:hypothetical protein
MHSDADLTAVVYDPPAPGLPHVAVLFDGAGALVAASPVESIEAGEAALACLVGEVASRAEADVASAGAGARSVLT